MRILPSFLTRTELLLHGAQLFSMIPCSRWSLIILSDASLASGGVCLGVLVIFGLSTVVVMSHIVVCILAESGLAFKSPLENRCSKATTHFAAFHNFLGYSLNASNLHHIVAFLSF